MDSAVDRVVDAYLADAGGDAGRALREAVADALADLVEMSRRSSQKDRLISKGYARGRLPPPEMRLPIITMQAAAE